jgi:hypothetical protein
MSIPIPQRCHSRLRILLGTWIKTAPAHSSVGETSRLLLNCAASPDDVHNNRTAEGLGEMRPTAGRCQSAPLSCRPSRGAAGLTSHLLNMRGRGLAPLGVDGFGGHSSRRIVEMSNLNLGAAWVGLPVNRSPVVQGSSQCLQAVRHNDSLIASGVVVKSCKLLIVPR